MVYEPSLHHFITLLLLHAGYLQLNSQSKTGENVTIKILTKKLRIRKVAFKNIGNSKQGGVF